MYPQPGPFADAGSTGQEYAMLPLYTNTGTSLHPTYLFYLMGSAIDIGGLSHFETLSNAPSLTASTSISNNTTGSTGRFRQSKQAGAKKVYYRGAPNWSFTLNVAELIADNTAATETLWISQRHAVTNDTYGEYLEEAMTIAQSGGRPLENSKCQPLLLHVKHLTEFVLQVFYKCIGMKEIVSITKFWISRQLLMVIGFRSSVARKHCNTTLGMQAGRQCKRMHTFMA
jgi:hypothetical protein